MRWWRGARVCVLDEMGGEEEVFGQIKMGGEEKVLCLMHCNAFMRKLVAENQCIKQPAATSSNDTTINNISLERREKEQ